MVPYVRAQWRNLAENDGLATIANTTGVVASTVTMETPQAAA
jgi:hypothetical protein